MDLFFDEYQKSDELTFPYVHKRFTKGQVIRFVLEKSDRVSQKMNAIIEEHGGDAADTSDRIRAMIVMCARRWTIKLPKSYIRPVLDEDGNKQYDDDENLITEPHPLAGKVPPITWEYVMSLPDWLLRDIALEVGVKYAGPFRDSGGTEVVQDAAPSAPSPQTA